MQAYLLQELEAVAGDPAESSKKLIIIATQSPSMLRILCPNDLNKLVFFINENTPPFQIESEAPELKETSVKAFLPRIGESHKLVFFCPKAILIEGPSDEIVCNGLASKFTLSLGAAGAQTVPLGGKGEIPTILKLFQKIQRKCTVLADLDNLTDNGKFLKCYYGHQDLDKAVEKTNQSFQDFAQQLRSDFKQRINGHWTDISSTAEQHRYWTERDTDKEETVAKQRAGLAVLLSRNESDIQKWHDGKEWLKLRKRWTILLEILKTVGCFVLRRGRIEDYYRPTSGNQRRQKPYAAAEEAAQFNSDTYGYLEKTYPEVLRMLRHAASTTKIDEAATLITSVGAAAGALFININPEMIMEQPPIIPGR